MKSIAVAIAVAGTIATVVGTTACAKQSQGTAVAGHGSTAAATSTADPSTTRTTATGTSTSPTPTGVSGPPTFGVVETTRAPLTPGAQTCASPQRAPDTQSITYVKASSPGTPEIELLVPGTWTNKIGPDDALELTGPDGLSGRVTVLPTELGPVEAFDKDNEDAMDKAPISSQSLLPAELCGYSGQKMIGSWSGSGGEPLQYADRTAHVWTNAANYLVAIHVQGPQKAPGFDAASEVILGDFGIRIP